MNNLEFTIQNVNFKTSYNEKDTVISVDSVPRSYEIFFVSGSQDFSWISKIIKSHSRPVVLIDRKVRSTILSNLNLDNIPCYEIDAVETNKDINSVLDVCDFLTAHGANRGSMLFVIGGGIVQDIGAFCGAMYKRGIPWTFIPTTLLSQADSCLGGKTAVNFKNTKNLLGLFSAPRQVLIDVHFLKSLSTDDIFSGIGEIYRLLITGGNQSFEILENKINSKDIFTIEQLIKHSLNVKKTIVEYDEFEIDIRRSMNYGHSVGHALESASSYIIPHGQGVTVGIMVENQISYNRGILSKLDLEKMESIGLNLLSESTKKFLSTFDPHTLTGYLINDKKAVGSVVKIATLEKIGVMKFLDLDMSSNGQDEVVKAFKDVFK